MRETNRLWYRGAEQSLPRAKLGGERQRPFPSCRRTRRTKRGEAPKYLDALLSFANPSKSCWRLQHLPESPEVGTQGCGEENHVQNLAESRSRTKLERLRIDRDGQPTSCRGRPT